MRNIYLKSIAMLIVFNLPIGCARDLSSSTYTSSSTFNLTLEGEVLSVRPIIIKESDNLADNSVGMLGGGVMGAAVGSNVGSGNGQTAAIVGLAVAGAAVGAVVQNGMSKANGFEYIVKIDQSKINSDLYGYNKMARDALSSAVTSGLITIVQSQDNFIPQNHKVYVIFSDKRVRVIKASS